MATEEVIVEIGAEDNASSTLEKVGDSAKSLGDKAEEGAAKGNSGFAKFTGTLKSMTPILLGVGAAVAGGLVLAVNAARGAEEQMARVDAILRTMGDAGMKAKGQIEEVSGAMVKLGFDDEDAAESMAKLYQRTNDVAEAQNLLTLSADLARAKQIDLGAATDLVGQVLAGNGRVLKQFGIDVKEAATPMEQLAELQKKVAGQSEAYANTFNGQMDRLQVTWGNFLESVGAPLLGILTKVLDGFLDWIDSMGGAEAMIAQLKPVIESLIPILQFVWEVLSTVVGLFIQAITDMHTIWTNNMYGIRDIATVVWAAIKLVVETALNLIKGALNVFIGIITLDWNKVWEGLKQITSAGANFISTIWGAMMDGVKAVASTVWEGIKDVFKGGINWIIEKLNFVINAYSSVIGKVPGIGKKMTIPTIPYLAEGGIVTQPTLAMIGEAGAEAVIPLNSPKARGLGAGGGVSVVIQGNNFYGDDEQFAQKIGDQIMRMLEPHLQFATS